MAALNDYCKEGKRKELSNKVIIFTLFKQISHQTMKNTRQDASA